MFFMCLFYASRARLTEVSYVFKSLSVMLKFIKSLPNQSDGKCLFVFFLSLILIFHTLDVSNLMIVRIC